MAVPESQLDTWAKQGSVTQSKNTYATIKGVLEAPTTPYADKSYDSFLQGSYRNDTNVYAESDVDVVMRLDSTYYYDTTDLTPTEKAAYEAATGGATYGYAEFRADVISLLRKKFTSDIVLGNKAIRVKANGSRRNADVLVCVQFRRYFEFNGLADQRYAEGICFFLPNGTRIVNFPKQHSANCTAKHQTTDGWFKPMVRIVKNMRNKMVEDDLLGKGVAPSYFIEGLLYNVPDDKFGDCYADTFAEAFNWIKSANLSEFVCPNELYYLIRDTAICWPPSDCDKFLAATTKFWNDW